MMFSDAARAWLARQTGTDISALEVTPLKGSTSSSVFLVCAGTADDAAHYVLRVLDNKEWLALEPDLAEHEAAVLKHAARAGLAAPRPVAFTATGAEFGVPVVLMTFVAGEIVLTPEQERLEQLAVELARIHSVSAASLPWQYHSWVNPDLLRTPTRTSAPAAWERGIARWRAGAPPAPQVFLHRDFHPMNVLWRANEISGVVDWINGCRGPAGADVAHCRTNLALMYGVAVANDFLNAYRRANPAFVYDAYWDLDSIFDMCLPEPQVYAPWREFGLPGLTVDLLGQRLDDYMLSLAQKI